MRRTPWSTYEPTLPAAPGSADALIFELRHELLTLRDQVPALQAARRADAAEIRRLTDALQRAERAVSDLRASYRQLAARTRPDGLSAEDGAQIDDAADAEIEQQERDTQQEMQWWEQFH